MPAVSTRRGRLGAPRPGKAVHRPAARLGRARPGWMALSIGAAVGVLGGMIGLGGAELRLPLLIGVFRFVALQAVILNKAISLLVVVTAIPARLPAVSYAEVSSQWHVIVTLLCGSLAGCLAWRDFGDQDAFGDALQGPRSVTCRRRRGNCGNSHRLASVSVAVDAGSDDRWGGRRCRHRGGGSPDGSRRR